MKHIITTYTRAILLMALMLLMPSAMWAEKQAYAEYANGTLTFRYDENQASSKAETYSIPEIDDFPDWLEHNNLIRKVVFDESFKDVRPKYCSGWFYQMDYLTDIQGMDYLCTDAVEDMSYMFYHCSFLTSLDLTHFNTSKVKNMSKMFDTDTKLACIYVTSLFVTDQVEESSNMFRNCTSLPSFSSDYTDKTKASEYLTYLTLQPWVEYQTDTKTLTFHYDARKDITTATAKYDLPASGVAPDWLANQIFIKKVVFNEDFQDVRPESCVKWFFKMKNLTDITGLEYLNTSEVKDMDHMFCECGSLTTLDLSHFCTENVTKMSSMFYSCEKLTSLNVSSFKTRKVEDMNFMFSHCKKLTELNLGSFDTQNVTNMEGMFYIGEALTHIYVSDLFVTDQVTNSENMFYYCAKLPGFDKSYLDKTKASEYLTLLPAQPWVEYQDATKTLTFHYDNIRSTVAATAQYDLPTANEDPGWLEHGEDITTVVFDQNFKNVFPTSCNKWFYDMMALTDIQGTEYLCTDSVTDMNHMFYGCKGLTTLDLTSFDTKKTDDMSNMFFHCDNLANIYVSSSFVLDQVTVSDDMFYSCDKLPGFTSTNPTNKTMAPVYLTYIQPWVEYQDATKTLTFHNDRTQDAVKATAQYDFPESGVDPGWLKHKDDITTVVFRENFKNARPVRCTKWFYQMNNLTDIQGMEYLCTDAVNDMSNMFYQCSHLTSIDLSRFNTASVSTMTGMFQYCSALTQLDLSTFNTEKVDDMSYMFENCEQLTSLDLTTFDTRKVTNMSGMFFYDRALAHIYVTDLFAVEQVTSYGDMFYYCSKLPHFDMRVTKEKAHYDEANGGYLTLRRKISVGDKQYNVDGYASPMCYDNVTFTDGAAYSAPCAFSFDADKTASYTRTVSNHWATLCLPFAFSADDNSTARFYSVKSYTDGNIAVTALTGTIAAGTPVLAYVSDGELSVSATAAAAVAEAVSNEKLKGAFTQTEVADDDYIIANDHFWNAAWLKKNNTDTKNVYVAPYRASLTLPSTEAKPNSISIGEGETDGIDSINGAASLENLLDGAELYDLQGRRLTAPQRGVIIVRKGGVSRKVVIK